MLNPILTHKQQSIATNNKMFNGLVNSDTIARSSDRIHHHTLKFGKVKVKFRANLSRYFSTKLVICNLQLEERSLRRQQSQHQLGCKGDYRLSAYALPRLCKGFVGTPHLITLNKIRKGKLRAFNSYIKKRGTATT